MFRVLENTQSINPKLYIDSSSCKVIMSPFKRKVKMSPHVFRVISLLCRNYLSGGRSTYGGDNFESERNCKISDDNGIRWIESSNNKATTLLGLSKRQIIRLKNKVRRDNLMGIVHGNCGRTPKIAIDKETKEIILNPRLFLKVRYG